MMHINLADFLQKNNILHQTPFTHLDCMEVSAVAEQVTGRCGGQVRCVPGRQLAEADNLPPTARLTGCQLLVSFRLIFVDSSS